MYAQTGLWLTVNGVHLIRRGSVWLTSVAAPSSTLARTNSGTRTVTRRIVEGNGLTVLSPGVRYLDQGAWRWDTSLFKNTNVNERVSVQFRVEASNVLNHTNFDQIGTAFLFDPIHFGQVLSARDPRIIQLGLKVVF